MGTDIHLKAEVYLFDEEDRTKGAWYCVPDPIRPCQSCDGTGKRLIRWGEDRRRIDPPLVTDEDCVWCSTEHVREMLAKYGDEDGYYGMKLRDLQRAQAEKGPGHVVTEWYDDRNYNVFGILADVRNGVGFAGVDTGDAWPVIAYPRGVPDDCSPEVAAYMANYDHTPSWVTMDEITHYPWKETVRKKRGWVGPSAFAEFLDTGRPSGWCGSVWGGDIKHISNTEMALALQLEPNLRVEDGHTSRMYTQIEWEQTAADVAESFLEAMKELAATVGENPARIVFYFDS